jgi:hypothetical protein
VRRYISAILRKTGARNRLEAVASLRVPAGSNDGDPMTATQPHLAWCGCVGGTGQS